MSLLDCREKLRKVSGKALLPRIRTEVSKTTFGYDSILLKYKFLEYSIRLIACNWSHTNSRNGKSLTSCGAERATRR